MLSVIVQATLVRTIVDSPIFMIIIFIISGKKFSKTINLTLTEGVEINEVSVSTLTFAFNIVIVVMIFRSTRLFQIQTSLT